MRVGFERVKPIETFSTDDFAWQADLLGQSSASDKAAQNYR